jgi:hypothetical protein
MNFDFQTVAFKLRLFQCAFPKVGLKGSGSERGQDLNLRPLGYGVNFQVVLSVFRFTFPDEVSFSFPGNFLSVFTFSVQQFPVLSVPCCAV